MNTQRAQSILVTLTARTDIALAILMVGIIFMLVVPLPTGLIDTLIAFNIMASMMLLMYFDLTRMSWPSAANRRCCQELATGSMNASLNYPMFYTTSRSSTNGPLTNP